MKKVISTVVCLAMAFTLVSCGSSKSSTTSTSSSSANSSIASTVATMLGAAPATSAAQQAGTNAGSAILSLYKNYKAAGKLDMSNTSNILSAIQLATSALQIKDNYKDAGFYKDFATGMVASATNLITNNNVGNTINTLVNTDFSSLSALGSQITGAANQVSNATVKAASSANTATAVSALNALLGSLE